MFHLVLAFILLALCFIQLFMYGVSARINGYTILGLWSLVIFVLIEGIVSITEIMNYIALL